MSISADCECEAPIQGREPRKKTLYFNNPTGGWFHNITDITLNVNPSQATAAYHVSQLKGPIQRVF